MTKRMIVVMMAAVLACAAMAQAGITWTGDMHPADPTTWTSSTNTAVGNTAAGSIVVDDDSDLLSNAGHIGIGADSVSTATITGAGSTWDNSFNFYVGHAGHGTLNIFDGGAVSSVGDAYLGYSAGSSGAVAVSGTGSMLTTDKLYVGGRGDGTMVVTDGGTVISDGGNIGDQPGVTGVAIVSGEGSTWNVTDSQFAVGTWGHGRLVITRNGLVRVGFRLTIDHNGDGHSSVDLNTGGRLALLGDADDSLLDFFGIIIGGTDKIRYWNEGASGWADITGATYGDDYTLAYHTEGDLAGYTVLTVTAIPEPATMSLLALGACLPVFCRKRR